MTTLNELVAIIAGEAGVRPLDVHLPVWPFWMAGAACEAHLRAARSRAADLPAPRRLLHEEPRVRHQPRARGAGLCPGGRSAHGHAAHAGVVSRTGVAVDVATGIPRAQDELFAPGTSARQKYARWSSAATAWARCCCYEFVQLTSQWVPGALGLALRKMLYPWLLGACGRNVVFGQHVVLRHPHKIRIGDDVVIDDHCLLDAKGDTNAGITIGAGMFIGRNTILSCKNGDIVLGDGANIGFNCEIFSAARVERGRAHAAGRLLLPHRRRPRLEGRRPAGARAGPPRHGHHGRRRGVARRRREGARRHDHRRRRHRRRRGGGDRRCAGRGHRRRRAGQGRRVARASRRRHEPETERPAGLRSPRAGKARACTASSACSRG